MSIITQLTNAIELANTAILVSKKIRDLRVENHLLTTELKKYKQIVIDLELKLTQS
jgi:hypothetical protein